MCADTRMDMRMDMCIGVRMGMCIGVCMGMCIGVRMGHVHEQMCVYTRRHVQRHAKKSICFLALYQQSEL